MERVVKVGKIYKHFKGNLIEVLCIAKNTESMEDMDIYKHLDKDDYWARPYDMFNSLVDIEKYPDIKQKYRFEEVD